MLRAELALACLCLVCCTAALRAPRRTVLLDDFGAPPREPLAADVPAGASRFDVEDNFENRGGFFPTVADNWEQRGALVKRAADLEEFPPGFSGKVVRGGSKLAKVSGNEIVGDPAHADQPGKGELIWSEDATPVQPTPWDLQWDGGAPAWAEEGEREGSDREGPDEREVEGQEVDAVEHNMAMDEAQDAEEREAESFAALPPDESSLTFDQDYELVRRAAEKSLARLAALTKHSGTHRGARGSLGKPQNKHMWQYWATKDDDLKAQAAGKLAKKAWELQRKYLKKMKSMCPMCSAMPGPKELSKMFCRTCEQFPESWVSAVFWAALCSSMHGPLLHCQESF